ncbi:MAG: BolA family protein [Pseudomonadota bacterium]
MSIEVTIKERLEAALDPNKLVVTNQSHLHAGHAGDDGSGESHFKIEISSKKFDGVSRIERERMIHKALGDVMERIHALSVRVIP